MSKRAGLLCLGRSYGLITATREAAASCDWHGGSNAFAALFLARFPGACAFVQGTNGMPRIPLKVQSRANPARGAFGLTLIAAGPVPQVALWTLDASPEVCPWVHGTSGKANVLVCRDGYVCAATDDNAGK
jgi:hypothetical protein